MMPLMVTGGFRTREGMEEALRHDAIDVIGLGRPLITDPSAPKRLLAGENRELPAYERTMRWGPGLFGPTSKVFLLKAINVIGQQGWYCLEIFRLAKGLKPSRNRGVFRAFVSYMWDENVKAGRLHRARRLAAKSAPPASSRPMAGLSGQEAPLK